VIIAEVDGLAVGFGMYSEFSQRSYKFTVEHSFTLVLIFTEKELGKIILSELISLPKGLHTMIGVIDENQSSVDFHEKFGFKTVGIIKESGYKFDRWPFSLYAVVTRIKKRLFSQEKPF
jgi:phosphinothricin acetyltransferase